nr:hypothetical protein [Polaromonas sp. AER18D-145]
MSTLPVALLPAAVPASTAVPVSATATGPSLLPVRLTVTVALPPSLVATVKVSLTACPALRLFSALAVV